MSDVIRDILRKHKNKGGAPTKFTRPVLKVLLKAARLGMPMTLATKAAGISTEALGQWKRKYPKLVEALARARARGAEARLRRIEKASHEDWRASAWLLEKTMPEHFSRNRVEVTGADGGPVTVVLNLPPKNGNGGEVVDVPEVPALPEGDANGAAE